MVQNPPLSGPVSGGWAGRRPGVAGRARLRLVGARCGWVWSGVGGRVGRARPGDPSLVAGGGVVAAGEWGNCSIRGATRRRHAVAVRLMVQNPPLSGPVSGGWAGRRPGVAGRARLRLVGARCGWVWSGVGGRVGRARPGDPSLVAGGGVVAAGEWGNCSIRGATRRRHAVAVRLMVQNPPLSGPVSGGWAGRRPGVARRARLRLVEARCGRVRAGVPTLGIGGLRAGRARDARHASNARSAAGVRR